MEKVRFFNSVRIKFVLIFVLLIFIAMQIMGAYFVSSLEKQLVSNFQSSVKSRIGMLMLTVESEMLKPPTSRTDGDLPLEALLGNALTDYATEDFAEIVVIDQHAVILASSSTENADELVNKKSKDPLVLQVLNSGISNTEGGSNRQNWVFAEPIISSKDGTTIGCLLVYANTGQVYQQVDEISNIMKTGTLISMLITALIGLILAQMITKPIAEMKKQALAMSKGHYNRSARIFGYDEIGQLAMTFNHLSKQLQDAQSTTEAEKRKLSSILTNMSDGVIATDRKGHVILINDPALAMLSKDNEEEAMTKTLTQLLDIENEYTFEDLLTQQEDLTLDYSDRGQKYFLRAQFSTIENESGFVSGLITVLHDTTEHEKIEDERKEFVANVSHELRTPLTTMRSYLEALTDGAIKNEVLSNKFLGVVQGETERMIRMVNDLLNLSRLENGSISLNKEWTDFGRFFNRIIDRFEMSIERGVTFKRDIPNSPAFVEIDRDKVNQVIDNVISNALKYSPDGGQISFRVQILEETIEVSIRDQGMGMPKGNVEKIFKRFYRVDKARSRKLGGTGLGLAIAKEVITAHHGNIFARSIEGVGTTIIFSLPYEVNNGDDWE